MSYGPPDAIDPSALRRALVVTLKHHGDVLLASPVFTALRHAAPQAEIDALAYAETAAMLALHPAIAELHTIERGWKEQPLLARAAAEWRLFAALRARRYELLIQLSDHPRGAWLARALGVRHAVAPDLPGKSEFWRRSFTHRYPQAGRRHTVEFNLDALRRIGVQPRPEDRRLVLLPGAEAEARAQELLASNGLTRGAYVQLHPASRWQFKGWPADKFAGLAEFLLQRSLPMVMTAAPDPRECALAADIVRRSRAPIVDLAGRLSLKELAAVSAGARLFVGVDSAPMHIAAAMGTPVVALFGPSGEDEWSPWMTRHRVVASGAHRCRPCGRDGCGGGKVSECLTELPVEAVSAAVESLLQE